jgi:hypothetical protein
MPPPAAPAPQDPHQGDHRREDSNNDEHMAEINMIQWTSGSMIWRKLSYHLIRGYRMLALRSKHNTLLFLLVVA